MTNLFTSKRSRSFILWMIIICCLLPFIILSFLSVMASDDYTLAMLYRDHSFGKAQGIMYFGWAGRFASTFFSGLFVKSGIMSCYYFIPALTLLFLTWIAFLFLLTSINKHLLGQVFSTGAVALVSFLFFFLDLYTMADIASGIYWFSSAIVYQSAFILFLLLLSCLIRRFYVSGSAYRTLLKDSILMGLVLAIVGSNEVAAVFLILFLLCLIGLSYFYRRTAARVLFVYLAVAVAAGILITFTSGVISVRRHLMNNHTSYMNVLPIIFFRTIAVFFYIMKEPLFWMMAFFLWLLGVKTGANPAATEFPDLFKRKGVLLPGLAITLVLVIGTLTPVLMVSKGSLPPRAMNNLIAMTILCLLALSFVTGARCAALALPLSAVNVPAGWIIIVGGCGLIASSNYLQAWKSVFSGYFYHAVLEDRQHLFMTAKDHHRRTVTIEPYEQAVKEKIHEVFPHGTFETVNEILQESPAAIYYYNEAEDPSPTFLNYYDLGSIIVMKK